MSECHHYVPILKLKQGERGAVELLPDALKKRLTPLFEVPPPGLVRRKGVERRQTLDEVLEGVGEQLRRALGPERGFVDGLLLPRGPLMAGGQHAMEYLFDEARRAGAQVVPVCGPERDACYQQVVKEALKVDGRGMCMRIRAPELFESLLPIMLQQMVETLGVAPSEVDLLLDCGSLRAEHLGLLKRSLPTVLGALPHVESWRSLTIAGGSFPESLKHITTAANIPRLEWHLWQGLRERAAQLSRMPDYGDYAVQSPQTPTALSARYQGSANIRYAHGDKWLILRGRSLEQYGFEQYHALCELLRGHEAFQGRHCCWGDDFIFHCAGEAEGPGNASIWRKVGTHHHLTVVLRLLATAHAP